MNAPTIRARTEPPASIFREVIAVIVNLDMMETIVKMVISHLHFLNESESVSSNLHLFCYSSAPRET